jgi:hypothetical protein
MRRNWAKATVRADPIDQANRSALPGFEPALRLIDDVDAALAAHDTIVAVPTAERFQ